MRLTVRVSLLALLVSFSLIPVVVIAVAGNLVAGRLTERLVERHNRTLCEEVVGRTGDLLQGADRLVRLASGLEAFRGLPSNVPGAGGSLDAARLESLEHAFRGVLETHPEFMNVFFGTTGGEFFMLGRRDEDLWVRRSAAGPDGRMRTYWAASATGEPLEVEAAVFDPTTRPWFGPALSADLGPEAPPVWTAPYVFRASRKVGVTVSRRVAGKDGGVAGVLGIDLSLEDLSRVLAGFDLGEHGMAFILANAPAGSEVAPPESSADSVNVVAWSEGTSGIVRVERDQPRLATVSELEDARFHPDLARPRETGGATDRVHDSGGETHFTHLLPFARGNLAWWVGVSVPRSHFTEGLEFLQVFTWIVAGVTGIASVFLALVFSIRVTRPLEILAAKTGEVREGRLDVDFGVASFIEEIQALADSMRHMVVGLHELFVTRRYISGATRAMIAERTGRKISDQEARGMKTEAVVLFADIRGFTTFGERNSPEVVIELLNRYLSLGSECVHRHGGVVDKFIGDELMALFLGSGREVDAVAAALDLQEGIRKVNEERERERKERVEMGIGIHSGPVVMGDMGSETRMDYSAIGDTVNVASRLQRLAGRGEIVVSKPVAEAARDRFETVYVDEQEVRGREALVSVYRVSGYLRCDPQSAPQPPHADDGG